MTVLAAPINDTTRTIQVDAGIANPSYPLFRTLDAETIKVTGGATTVAWQIERGVGDTTPAAHIAGTTLATDATPFGASEGGGGVSVDNLVDPPEEVTTIVAPGAVVGAGSATLPTVVVSPDDPGAIGAGNLWLQSNAGEGGDDYYQLNVRNDTDDGWFGAGPITNTDRETYVTIASPDDSVELQINNDGEGFSSIAGAEGFGVQQLILANDVTISKGADAPTAGAGVVATVGSLYLRTDGTIWRKSGAGDTAWTEVFGPDSLANYEATGGILVTATGFVFQTVGEMALNAAAIVAPFLPTSDPANETELWNDADLSALKLADPSTADAEDVGIALNALIDRLAGTLKVSAG